MVSKMDRLDKIDKVDEAEEKVYVLVYKKNPTDTNSYFEYQNLYLGAAITTEDLSIAHRMRLIDAENIIGLMNEPEYWSIWSIKKDWVLYQRYEKHLVKQKIKQLEKEIADLQEELYI